MPFDKGKTPQGAKPFKPGQSGNPKGRPKKLPELDTLLADVLGEEKDGMTAAEAILKKLRQMAAQGNIRAAEILLERAYGKAKQSHEITGKDGKDLIPAKMSNEELLSAVEAILGRTDSDS
jgi:hypothetical protein